MSQNEWILCRKLKLMWWPYCLSFCHSCSFYIQTEKSLNIFCFSVMALTFLFGFFVIVFCIKKRLSTIFIFTFANCLRLYLSKAEWKDFLKITATTKSLAPFYKHINKKSKHSATIISRSINVNVGLVISLCHYLPCSQVTQFDSRALFSRV